MSSNAPGPRPRQVTIGGWVIAVASAVLVVTVFDTMANLHSVDTRDKLTTALTTGSLKDLGLSVDDALSLMRVALLVAGAAAAVTGILGIFVLQRHPAARIVLTVAAVPVVLTAPVAGGLLGVMIGVATAFLWSGPARDWFAGRPPAVREAARPAAQRPPDHAPAPPPASDSGPWSPAGGPPVAPPHMPGWGQPPGGPGMPPPTPPYAQQSSDPASWAPPSVPAGAATSPRVPTQVRVACILTWVFSMLTAVMYVAVIILVAADRGEVIDRLRDSASVRDTSLSDSTLVGVVIAASAMVILWCLVASGLAILTWQRHSWARVVLLVSIGVASLVEVLALPYTLLHLGAAVTAFVLLLRAPVRAWFSKDGGPGAPARWRTEAQGPGPQASGQPPAPPPERPSGKPPVW
jgi:hypothetical protein